MTTEELIESIYQRHVAALALVNCDTGPARMALWLALTELADRLDDAAPAWLQPEVEPATAAATTAAATTTAATVPPTNGAYAHAEPDAGRAPAALSLATLDDESRQIVRELDGGVRTWRNVDGADRRVLVLAIVKELTEQNGGAVTLEQFERLKPVWLPKFQTLTVTLGMTWNQMRVASQEPF